jgi:type IV pilus assembly protein PilV
MQTASPAAASDGRRFAPPGQRGVGLIEVLIAVLVLSIGLLGIALMQVRSLSGNNSSMARSSAVIASYSVLEILRARRADALGMDQTLDADDCDADGSAYMIAQLNAWCESNLSADRLGEHAAATIECGADGVCTVTITFHTLDCGQSDDGQSADSLCTQSVGEADIPAQQIVTKALL